MSGDPTEIIIFTVSGLGHTIRTQVFWESLKVTKNNNLTALLRECRRMTEEQIDLHNQPFLTKSKSVDNSK
jgi:hypothetical protein